MSELSSEHLAVLAAMVTDRLRTAAEIAVLAGVSAEIAAKRARSLTRSRLAVQRTLSGTPRWVVTSEGQGVIRRAVRRMDAPGDVLVIRTDQPEDGKS